MYLDARGKQCPMPVIMAKKELDGGCTDLTVAVDNETAVKNLTKMATNLGLTVESSGKDGDYEIHITGELTADGRETAPAQFCELPATANYSVFVSKDHLGEGDPVLGRNLIRMAIYTLSEGDNVPKALLFMNGGVKLVAGEEPQITESVKKLISRGCEVLVCGTCLNFYGLSDKLEAGTVSNMYEILERMQKSSNTITL